MSAYRFTNFLQLIYEKNFYVISFNWSSFERVRIISYKVVSKRQNPTGLG